MRRLSVRCSFVAVCFGTAAFAWAGPAAAQGPALTGVVTDSLSGEPLVGATVFLSGMDVTATTDEEGRFVFQELPAGTYLVGFTHPRIDELAPYGSFPVEVTVPEGGGSTLELGTLSLETTLALACEEVGAPPGAAVAGTVWTGDGEVAVPGARVTLSRPGADGEEQLSGRTNAEGDFLFCGIPFGATVTLTPDFPGTQGATETVELAGAVGAVRDLSLKMPDAGGLEGNPLEIRVERTGVGAPAGAARVVGRVVDHADGDPVVGATIRLVEAEPVLTTDADGRFVFGNVAPGAYELEVEHVGYGTQRQIFEIEGGAVVELAVRIPSRPIALEGVTVDARRRTPAVEAKRAAGTRLDVMTRVDIAPLEGVTQHVGQLARRFPGVRVAGDPGVGGGVCVGSTRAAPPTTGCVPAMLVLDDMRFDGAQGAEILASIPLQDIESFEFLHPMQALPRFGPRAGMGALVIYTRGRGPYAERQR